MTHTGSPHGLDAVFANRTLSMRQITCVGFDCDYTLASYVPETFETLAHAETVSKLVRNFGYPEGPLRALSFDPKLMVRGLVIDKEHGNMLKVCIVGRSPSNCDLSLTPVAHRRLTVRLVSASPFDTICIADSIIHSGHKYVKLAYHGFAPLTRDERMATYNSNSDPPLDFESSRFAMVDTLFSLAEAHLYMSLVELKDQGKLGSLQKTYAELYRDSRAAVDLAHRDGSIKRKIAADPAKYIFPVRIDCVRLMTNRLSSRVRV